MKKISVFAGFVLALVISFAAQAFAQGVCYCAKDGGVRVFEKAFERDTNLDRTQPILTGNWSDPLSLMKSNAVPVVKKTGYRVMPGVGIGDCAHPFQYPAGCKMPVKADDFYDEQCLKVNSFLKLENTFIMTGPNKSPNIGKALKGPCVVAVEACAEPGC